MNLSYQGFALFQPRTSEFLEVPLSPLAGSKYEKTILWRSAVAAIGLHLGVVVFLIFGGSAQSENKYKPLAVVEFAHFDPEGGQPGGGEDDGAESIPEPALAPPPEPEPFIEPESVVESEPELESPPKVVESVSEKAAPAPAPPSPPPKEKPKPKPKPKPQKAATDKRKSGDQIQSAGSGAGSGVPGGGPGADQGGVGGGTGRGNPNVFKAYTAAIQKKLNRYKKYPPGARAQKLEGVVTVSFTVNRQGQVTDSRLVKSSGHPELDAEVMALVKRVSPFAPMPKEMTQTTINLTAPIQFSLR